ncbi:polysaccharide biosynthesis protein [Methylobacter sp. YRD-M1]|uniref:polysaccharide biosynthesis protein n=1 Tax=Methylobacter sp. YRD-M1 TaxID=2911520 RepID=UPI00227AEAC4|nr:nucleoside-diphosphate sugar epimerase/dehydratase [Methylobacter sp. YRD-M1]WAK02039.1 polysaccharide biosynthesis protein [Methylobacter sp. YRD-M1]
MKFKFRSRTTIFIHDLAMVAVAWFGAYWLRFNLDVIPDRYWQDIKQDLPYVIAIQGIVFWFLGLYRGVWRFASMPDLIRITKAVIIGIGLLALSFFLYNRVEGVPRAVLPLYLFLLLLLLSVPRFCYRFWKESILMERSGKRALIIGAGAAGEMLARDLLGETNSGYVPVAFVDDDRHKRKREIRGIRVVGDIEQLPVFVQKLDIEAILIAIPSATDSQMRRIIETCELCEVPFQTLPSVKDLLSGRISRDSLRDVSIEDILGRDPIHLDWQLIADNLHGKSIMVTGGGGSIGSELCKQLARVKPARLIIFDQSEFNLYKIDADLRTFHPEIRLEAVLGDVTDRLSVRRTIQKLKPDVIFHAAAYKHVPLLENQVREAVHNNVIGTKTVAEEAIEAGIERFVLISTDKAVNPTNVMGATKRAAEILCQNLSSRDGTRFMTVRFGNVLDSAGSVVPLFRAQIKAGGPVTVTHPDITRYFMTIPEACQLIMQAEVAGKGGEVFVLDMGEPIKIAYLAEQMIRLSGKRIGDDIEIKYVGLRPGEKLHEELFHEHERLRSTGYEKLLLANARLYDEVLWTTHIEKLVQACQQDNETEILRVLRSLVPEYQAEAPEHQSREEIMAHNLVPVANL